MVKLLEDMAATANNVGWSGRKSLPCNMSLCWAYNIALLLWNGNRTLTLEEKIGRYTIYFPVLLISEDRGRLQIRLPGKVASKWWLYTHLFSAPNATIPSGIYTHKDIEQISVVNKILFYVNVSWLLFGTEPRLNTNFQTSEYGWDSVLIIVVGEWVVTQWEIPGNNICANIFYEDTL